VRAGLAAGAFLLAVARAAAQDEGLARAAQDVLATLRPELRTQCLLPLEDENRLEWSFTPGRRRGVSLKEMNARERRTVHGLLQAALSARGYEKAAGVIELEGILRKIETFGALWRDPDLYWLAIFGEPSAARPWAFRFEGHHLSINLSSATGGIVAATPAFFGANPARVPAGSRAGWRLLAGEEDLARQLLGSFDERQWSRAVIATSAPADIILGPGRQRVPDPAGLEYAQMSEAQRRILMLLVSEYLGNTRPEVARGEREKIEKAGLAGIRFAWAGGSNRGQGHYYRIQGPTFVIEYDNTQDGANHVHSVWRDLENDFGGDLLRRHYAESAHHRGARPRGNGGMGPTTR
jgi:hypothetical protein